jgi:hypothetical protein
MATIFELKEQAVTETPLFLIECELTSGETERWSTHGVDCGGFSYEARLLDHNLLDIRSDSEDGIDSLSRVSLTLANADSYGSQIERTVGWKGARVTVSFLFYDVKRREPASESIVIFRGVANPPEEITETTIRLSLANRMNLQRLLLPEVRIQRRCPWKFPTTAEQRAEAVDGGTEGKFSPFYRCGYSPDVTGGQGNLSGGSPYPGCDYTRAQCEERGMFGADSLGGVTRRFGGIEFVPSTTMVRSHGEKAFHVSPLVENEGRYNDFVPIVYGTAWYAPPIVFARNDGNLTRIEVLLGMGEIQGVLKVIVNDVEIPLSQAGVNMTATGWYTEVSHGTRTGAFNPDFRDPSGQPLGDPYGSMAMMSLVVPNQIHDGRTLPRIEVLAQGIKLAAYSATGASLGEEFGNNPAWVILDVLRRSGWRLSEIDLSSFSKAAEICEEMIDATDLHGNPVSIPRFQCNLVVRTRRSVAEVVRGVRNSARLYLTLGTDGRLQLQTQGTLARQQPVKSAGSNSTEGLDGGWPAYEFGDGTLGFSGILRRSNGEPAIRLWGRSTADSPNRFSVEFQDSFNEYQQDSLSLLDVEDALRTGQEISATLNALGIPNSHQAARMAQLNLDKSIRGGTYVEFETSVRGAGLRPGDLITVTYLKDGLERQPFRIKSVAPGFNYRSARITAQIHSDSWYSDAIVGGGSGNGRQPGYEVGLPRPLLGNTVDEFGEPQFGVEETVEDAGGGQVSVWLSAGFIVPSRPKPGGVGIPRISLSVEGSDTGGTLAGDQMLYYAVSGAGPDATESPLSFLVRASIPPGSSTNSVRLAGLSFSQGTLGFHVYRGPNPARLYRIASDQPVSSTFLDTGFAAQLVSPPDENFDHANFYWRLELQPEASATAHSEYTIGNDTLEMAADQYGGATVRILRGKGAGQERAVTANTGTELTVEPTWDLEPDTTSTFVVAESSWNFGALGRTSPVRFQTANRIGATVHISGRSANVSNRECAYELSPLTRWRVGGGFGGGVDVDVSGKPVFGLQPTGKGSVEVTGIGFEDLANTRTISASALTLHYWNELGAATHALPAGIGASDIVIGLTSVGIGQSGDLIQVGREIMRVEEVLDGGLGYRVIRALYETVATAHEQGASVYHLRNKVYILPFVRDFFGSPASGSYSHPIYLPDARIAGAEMFASNSRGSSEVSAVSFTSTVEAGMRTLSGGQLSIQVEGYLAIQTDVAPPLVVEETHSVRDVFAVVRDAASGGPIQVQLRHDMETYCTLTIPAGATISNVVWGFGLPPLNAESQISLDIVSVGQGADAFPGKDLTVTIRL